MKRFIESEDRRQASLLPDSLEDYVTDENPVRVIDVFIDELDLAAMGFAGVAPEATGRPAYHPVDAAEDLSLRLSQSHPIEPTARTGDPAQHRVDVADRPPDAGLQDDRRLPPRQWAGDPRGLHTFRRAVPPAQSVHPVCRGGRREQVQGRQHPRQELHGGQGRQAHRAGGGQHRALPGSVGPRRPAARRRVRGKDNPHQGEDRRPAAADAIPEGDGKASRGSARQAGFSDRSRRPVDGDQRQGHGHRRLQCSDRR